MFQCSRKKSGFLFDGYNSWSPLMWSSIYRNWLLTEYKFQLHAGLIFPVLQQLHIWILDCRRFENQTRFLHPWFLKMYIKEIWPYERSGNSNVLLLHIQSKQNLTTRITNWGSYKDSECSRKTMLSEEHDSRSAEINSRKIFHSSRKIF